jgi:hypothetical protein
VKHGLLEQMTYNVLEDGAFRARSAVLRRRSVILNRKGKEGDANKA